MNSKKIIYYTSLILWVFSSAFLVYKYSLNAGYWLVPLLISLFFYVVLIISNKGFNKLITGITLLYIAFGGKFAFDLLVAVGDTLGV